MIKLKKIMKLLQILAALQSNFEAMEVQPLSSLSLNSVFIQTETSGINIEHSFENLKKDQVTIQQVEIKLKLFRFYEDFFKINEKRVTYFTGLANVSTLSTVFNCIKTKIYGNCVLSPFGQMILHITGV